MMTNIDFINVFGSFDVWILAKLFVVFTLAIYVVFAAIVIRQVFFLVSAINAGFSWLLKLIAFLHFLGAIFVLILAIIIL